MPPAAPDARVEAWIHGQPKQTRDLCIAAGALLDEGLPSSRQAIKWGYPTWVGNGNIASLMAYPAYVNLQFHQGASLPDPSGLLLGTGKGMRHVRLVHARDVKVPAVKALVRAAWRIDQARRAPAAPVRTVRAKAAR